MEKKDIILFVFVFAALIFSFYRRYMKKKNEGAGSKNVTITHKSGLAGQPDDYEPYSGKQK